MRCSKCGSEMKQEIVRILNEATLLPEMMKTAQYTCVNEKCEVFGQPVRFKPMPAPRFTRGEDHLSEKEQARLEQLRKVAMAPGLESTSLKVIDAISTYLAAGQPAMMAINQAAANQVVRTHATDALGKMAEESQGGIVTLGPKDIVVTDQRTIPQRAFKIRKSDWTPEDESKYVPPNYFVSRGRDYTPQWLAERLRGDDLQAELLRLFREQLRIHPGHSLKDTAEGIAIRIGRNEADVRRELDKLLERGILIKTENKEYFSICHFPPEHPSCRFCHQPMELLDEAEQKWYCYRDDQIWYDKEQRWHNPTQDAPRAARLPSRIEHASPKLLQQLAPDSQREIELTCLRLLQQVAIESEFETTSLKVIEAIETLEAAAIPALIEIGNRAANHAVRTYAHDTIIRIMESSKEPKRSHQERAISLNCPNCGGIASGVTSRCEYCGVELILSERGLLPRSIMPCPKCGNSMAGDAWLCVNCRQVLTRDAARLKELQRILLLEQENYMRVISQEMPEIAQRFEPDEFIYSLYYWKFGRSRSYEVVTDRKLVHYAFKRDPLREIPWSEFVRVVSPLTKKLPYDLLQRTACYILRVQTLKEDFVITFQTVKHGIFVGGDWEGCVNLYRTIKAAQNDYNNQRRNIKAIICSLNGLNEEQAAT